MGFRLVSKVLLFLICSVLSKVGFSQSPEHIYINKGNLMTVDGKTLPYFAFNRTKTFQEENTKIELYSGDSVKIIIVNTDSVNHGFSVKNELIQHLIPAGDSIEISLYFTEESTLIYHDHLNYGSYMGLVGMIVVRNPNSSARSFYWNLKDHQKSISHAIDTGGTVDWSKYYPDYFTINGRSNPHINSDTTARVTGKVGDTIRIHITNSGIAVHSLHFHGYHCTIVQSSGHPDHKGRVKDTFPIDSMEVLVLELVPHQTGEYPVHDHNLVAVSGGNIYPNGMFLTLLIQ